MEYTSTRNRKKPSFNHFWSRGYVIIWSKIPIQGLSPIMNSGTKAWAFCWVIVFLPANGYDETGVGMDNFQWICSCWLGWIIFNGYAVVVGSLLFPRRGLANVQPDRQDLCTTIPLAACIYPSGMPVNAKLVVARSCQAARQGTRHLGKTRLLGSARPTGQNYFPSCCFLLIINSTGPIGNLSFRVTPSAFR